MKCVRCNRAINQDHGGIVGYPVGPICARLMGLASTKPQLKAKPVVRIDQADLFEGEFYFLTKGDEDRENTMRTTSNAAD